MFFQRSAALLAAAGIAGGCSAFRPRNSWRYLLVIIFLMSGGCVSSSYMRVGQKTYPPRPDNYLIDVYVSVDAPVQVQQSISNAKPIAELPASGSLIGRIDTDGAPAASWAAVIEDAKSKARALGGDAIVIRQWGSPMAAMTYGQPMYGKAIALEVIRLKD